MDAKSAQMLILNVCKMMLADELSFIIGSRKIVRLLRLAELSDNDPDNLVFIAIESETDDVPLGEARRHWSRSAVNANSANWDEAEAWAKRTGSNAAKNLVQRLEE
ncbi:MAG: hypothetical protein WBC90_15395 [Albidovulum sp.]